jgi:hypothetical protein
VPTAKTIADAYRMTKTAVVMAAPGIGYFFTSPVAAPWSLTSTFCSRWS